MFSLLKCSLVLAVLELTQFHEGLALGLHARCSTPLKASGSCVYLEECPQVATILRKKTISKDERNFVHSSHCGRSKEGRPLVCCADPVIQRSNVLPSTSECGLDLSDRIVGGQQTELDEFPWLALLKYRKTNGQSGFHCGASLINARYVLTAAHCVNSEKWDIVGVRLGEYDASNKGKDCDGSRCADVPLDVGVEKIKVHESYQMKSRDNHNDIALIRMNRNVQFTDFVQPICLPVGKTERNRHLDGLKLTAAGWGRTETGTGSDVKLKVKLDVTDLTGCSMVYSQQRIAIRDTQICAGGDVGKDTCSGDSGGPLMLQSGHNYYLYGVVSFGPNKCGLQGVPGVYTYVPKYIDWIRNNLE